jgi:hypothetical protein
VLVDGEQQQQQPQPDQQQDPLDSSLLAGIAGPDMGFASAAAAAQAAAAASVAWQNQQAQLGGLDSSSGSSQASDPQSPGNDTAASLQTLQAHHVLYCMSDLQRLAVRREFVRINSPSSRATSSSSSSNSKVRFSQQLLLSCGEGSWPAVAVLLAAWLHWHGGQDMVVAVAAVSKVMGVGVDEGLLQEVQRLLVVRAKERFSRVMLTWRYGGLSAEVSE